MAVLPALPFQPTPFFKNKNRAFWNLQFVGWGGAFLLRAMSGIVNGQDLSFFAIIAIETVAGFSISLMLSTIYGRLIDKRPIVTWSVTGISLLFAVLIFAFIDTWAFSLIRPNTDTSFTALLIGYLIYPLTLLGAWSALYFAINYFLQVEEQQDRLERLELQATTAQLAMLRYQLNPHFLFNTLNSISTLVLLKQTKQANAMLTRLSGFLRHTLVTQPGGKVTVAQEVDTLQLYLEIERMRFEDRLRTNFEIDDAAAKACMPSMLLQPLVENAIKYAVSPQMEGAEIELIARRIGNRLRLSVSDTGPGVQGAGSQSELPHSITQNGASARGVTSTNVGLANIRDRLAQAYGDESRFEIRAPADGGFTVIIEIPYEVAEENTASSKEKATRQEDASKEPGQSANPSTPQRAQTPTLPARQIGSTT